MGASETPWSPSALLAALTAGGLAASTEDNQLAPYASDFGGIRRGVVEGVVWPRTTQEVEVVVELARRARAPLRPRGRGLSQSGQAVPRGGWVVDLRELSAVSAVDETDRTIDVEAGASFRQVVDACRSTGLLPKVLPLKLDLSVGGVLSAGGFGITSHRHGLVVSHVREFEAVLGTGQRVLAGPQRERSVYDLVLGGLGQAGILTRATLELEPVAPALRTISLFYDDFELFLSDLVRLGERPRAQHVEAFCSSSFMGLKKAPTGQRMPLLAWHYGLQVSVETRPNEDAEAIERSLVEGLSFARRLHDESDDPWSFTSRYDLRFSSMRASGTWEQEHPWFEVLLPLEAARQIVPEALRLLPPFFGDGHRLLLFADTDRPRAFAFPRGRPVIGFAVLPVGIPSAFRSMALGALEKLDALCRSAGGERYPSGLLFPQVSDPVTADKSVGWPDERPGVLYAAHRAAVHQYDPLGLFSSSALSLSA